MPNVETSFVDTNVLISATDTARAFHERSRAVLVNQAGLVLSPQVLREYLVVCTRPVDVNGLGMSTEEAMGNIRVFRSALRLLTDHRQIWSTFAALLESHPVQGKRLHDLWIVATAVAHEVPRLLTWNTKDFALFGSVISVETPA